MTETIQSSPLRKGSVKLFWTVHQPNCVGISSTTDTAESTGIISNLAGLQAHEVINNKDVIKIFFIILPSADCNSFPSISIPANVNITCIPPNFSLRARRISTGWSA